MIFNGGAGKMGFSSRSHYGTRALMELALRQGDGPVHLETLAEVQGIPVRYLAKIAQELRRCGLVRSVRGASGGYLLGRSADEICVMDIVRCLDGSVAPAECVERPDLCNNAPNCVARGVWESVNNAIIDVLESVTLQDLVNRCREKEKKEEVDLSAKS